MRYEGTLIVSCVNVAVFFVDRRTESVCASFILTDVADIERQDIQPYFESSGRVSITTTCVDPPFEPPVRAFLSRAYPGIHVSEWECMPAYRKMPALILTGRVPEVDSNDGFVSVKRRNSVYDDDDDEEEEEEERHISNETWFTPTVGTSVPVKPPMPTWRTVWNLQFGT